MRPIKITMSAFGAYKGVTILDMERLGSQGVYLITGETGAGKTTVFDAIVFALYGSASGDSRDGKMMRSMYADENTPTFVEMEFEVKGERYRIKRNPEYERPKLRGEGTVTASANAELYMPDGTVFDGKLKDVNDKIKEIMCVDRNQFCKIAMLAQGDFQRFLLDSTEKKTELLRRLFSTEIFERLQSILKEEYFEADAKCRDLSKNIDTYLSYIKFDEIDTLEIELENAPSIKEKREVIDRLIERDATTADRLKKQIDVLEEEVNKANNHLTLANDIIEKKNKKAKITNELEQKSKELEELKSACLKAKSREEEKSELLSRIHIYRQSLTQYKESDEKKKQYSDLKTELDRTQNNLKLSQNQLKEFKEEYECYKNTDSDLTKSQANRETLEKALDYLKRYLSAIDEKETLSKQFEQAKKEYAVADERYNSASEAYFNEQAGFLAVGLEDGKPCPVCGSISHPSPARLTEHAPDKKTVDMLKSKRDDADKCRNNLSAKITVVNGKIDTNYNELKSLTKKEEFSNKDLEIYKSHLQKINAKIDSLESNLKRRLDLDKRIPELQLSIEAQIKSANDISIKLAQLDAEVKAIKLEFENEAEALKEISNLENNAEAIQKEIDEAINKYNTCKSKLDELKGRESELAQELESVNEQDTDLEKLTQSLNEITRRKQTALDEHVKVCGRLSNNRDTAKLIDESSSNMIEAEEERAWKKSLSDTANGNISNHHKIKLEAYVLGEYFKRVLGRASARLMVMSDNHYELEIHNEPDNMRSQAGLEIDVIDHYNGTRRSVKSLSGGEKFMASLSIALGLSDEVQSSAGGVRLDAMFVDEGFGSLDSNTLELAMRALSGIAQSNRLVGIISHVDALNERIDKKIVVRKDAVEGSIAKIVV